MISMSKLGATSSIQVTQILTGILAQEICGTAQRYCHGTNQQYSNATSCYQFLTKEVRFGEAYEFGRNTLVCRMVHQNSEHNPALCLLIPATVLSYLLLICYTTCPYATFYNRRCGTWKLTQCEVWSCNAFRPLSEHFQRGMIDSPVYSGTFQTLCALSTYWPNWRGLLHG